METTITLTIPQIAMLDPAKSLRILQEEAGRGMTRIVETIATSARANVPVDTGILRGAIFTDVTPGSGAVLVQGTVGVGRQAPYAEDVECGTKPHWIEDISGLRGWARRVLGDEGRAIGVRDAIARHGTKPQPYFWPAVEDMRPRMQGIMDNAVALAVKRLEQR